MGDVWTCMWVMYEPVCDGCMDLYVDLYVGDVWTCDTRLSMCVCVWTCLYVCMYGPVCMCVCMDMCMGICRPVCMCMGMYVVDHM